VSGSGRSRAQGGAAGMWLVLCDAADVAGVWVYHGLLDRGLRPLELFTAQVLATALRIEHRIGNRTATEIETADGRRLLTAEVDGALNRLAWVPDQHLALAAEPDRRYATQELSALFLSWLHGLPGTVINRPSPGGLAGRWRHPCEWAILAARAGLTTIPYRRSSEEPPEEASVRHVQGETKEVFVISDRVTSSHSLPESVEAGSRRLARLADTALLGLEFADVGVDSWRFIGASPTPDLRPGGDAVINALYLALTQ
jgi:hypothetical protein